MCQVATGCVRLRRQWYCVCPWELPSTVTCLPRTAAAEEGRAAKRRRTGAAGSGGGEAPQATGDEAGVKVSGGRQPPLNTNPTVLVATRT